MIRRPALYGAGLHGAFYGATPMQPPGIGQPQGTRAMVPGPTAKGHGATRQDAPAAPLEPIGANPSRMVPPA